MKTISSKIIFSLLLTLNTLLLIGQHADCNQMVLLTDTIYHAKNISGYGDKLEFLSVNFNDKQLIEKERNSIWYLITIPASGEFTFDIKTQHKKDDWDFLIYPYKKNFCKRLTTQKINPIRGNFSRSSETGLSASSNHKFIGPGVQPNYSKAIQANKGEQYVLVVNNPKKSGRNHTLVLHYPKPKLFTIKTDTIKKVVPATISFKLSIKDKNSQKPISSNVSISGLRKERIALENITNYETTLSKISYEGVIEVAAKGYMLTSVEIKIPRNETHFIKHLLLDKLKVGEKVNLKNLKFFGNKAKFLPSTEGSLLTLLSFMQLNDKLTIEIEGHVNGPGQRNSKDYRELSKNRAKAVKSYLVKKGIAENRISFIGYGNSQMLFPSPKNSEEMSNNRRVEIKILSK